jgi:hypothetical protein
MHLTSSVVLFDPFQVKSQLTKITDIFVVDITTNTLLNIRVASLFSLMICTVTGTIDEVDRHIW